MTVRTARRALEAGLAHNAASRPVAASARFRAALRALAEDDRSRESAYVRARALLGLVMSDFELRADAAAAARTLDAAEEWADLAGAAAVGVAIHGQRGLMALRGGDRQGALQELDRAAERRDVAEPLDAAVLLLNRGSLNLELGRIGAARQDLVECRERAAAMGDGLLLFKAGHNLGYLEFLAGDLPRALALMSEAASSDHGGSPAISWLDRAQVLLEAGLVTEADSFLARAEDLFARSRLARDLAQVELDRARCALLTGRADDALVLARRARARFARRGNVAWTPQAELVVLRARLALAMTDGVRRGALRRVAADARALAERVPAGSGPARDLVRDAWLTAAEAEVEAGRVAQARAATAAAGRVGRTAPLPSQLHGHLVRARIAFEEGRTAAGRAHVRSGQRVLADHRRQLGSVEAVTAAAVHGERLWQAEVAAALAAGDGSWALQAVERGRATTAGPARVRPPQDPVLAERLAELRRTAEELRAGSGTEELSARATALRSGVRERAWQLGEGTAPPRAMTAAAVRAALRDSADGAVVDLIDHRGALHAVVVDRRGVRAAPGVDSRRVTELGRRLRADLEALSRPLPDALRAVVLRSLARGLAGLDELVIAPLGIAGPLHVVAGGETIALPWALLPSRRGLPTTVTDRLRPAGGAVPRAGVVALAGPDLARSAEEARAVAAAWPAAVAVTGAAADCATALAALGSARVVHVAAHGRHEADNPLFSWVRMADGPLFAHELEGLSLEGATVVLAACEVGRVSARAGGGSLGLASVLLRLGAEAVVAALAPVRDDLAAAIMPALHLELARGASPATAVAAVLGGQPAEEPAPLTCLVSGMPFPVP